MKTSLFANMNWLDWLLVVAFTAVLAFIASLLLPAYGWPLGAIAGLALLYLAKKRRDGVFAAADKDQSVPQEADPDKEK